MLSGTTRRAQRRGSRVHDDGKRGRQEPRLERRVTPGFAVELHRPGWALQHLDAHGAAAAEPQAPRAVRRPPHELEERAQTLHYAHGPKHHDVEPTVVRRDV